MDPHTFLFNFQQLQNDIVTDEIIKVDTATISYTKHNPICYENYALLKNLPTNTVLSKIKAEFNQRDRTPTLYFDESLNTSATTQFLQLHNYKKMWEDAWMFYENPIVYTPTFESVKRVESEKDLVLFLETFDLCYQKNDPQNPYGEVKNYIKGTEDAWYKFRGTDRLFYFIVFKDTKPVATVILNCLHGLGYISSVGSLQEVRGQGFGKLATLFAVYTSQQLKNTYHFLATEEGNYPNAFYKRLGFVTKLHGLGYQKK